MKKKLIIIIFILLTSLKVTAQENKTYNGGYLFLSFFDGTNATNIPKGKVETITYDLIYKKFVVIYRDEDSKLNIITFNYVGEEKSKSGKAILHYVESVSNDKYFVTNNLDSSSEIIFMREVPIEKKIVSLIINKCIKSSN